MAMMDNVLNIGPYLEILSLEASVLQPVDKAQSLPKLLLVLSVEVEEKNSTNTVNKEDPQYHSSHGVPKMVAEVHYVELGTDIFECTQGLVSTDHAQSKMLMTGERARPLTAKAVNTCSNRQDYKDEVRSLGVDGKGHKRDANARAK